MDRERQRPEIKVDRKRLLSGKRDNQIYILE